jgi:hypothetical protein
VVSNMMYMLETTHFYKERERHEYPRHLEMDTDHMTMRDTLYDIHCN